MGTIVEDFQPTITRQESKLLIIAKNEPRILKHISSYLGMNDKQSLMLAVIEDHNPTEKEDNILLPTESIAL